MRVPATRGTFLPILGLLAASACVRAGPRGATVSVPIPVGAVAESRTVQYTVPERDGQLTAAQLDSVAPRVRTLRADPAELLQVVGDTVPVAALVRLLAIDSLGTVLGELPYYDFGVSGRGFRLLQDGRVLVTRRGTVQFTARWPGQHWRGAASRRPSVQVALIVHDPR
jgi:hypothetical protein